MSPAFPDFSGGGAVAEARRCVSVQLSVPEGNLAAATGVVVSLVRVTLRLRPQKPGDARKAISKWG